MTGLKGKLRMADLTGYVVGAVTTFGSIFLTRYLIAKHERQVKVQEREMALRKEIYLGAAEALSAGFSAVGRLSNMNISAQDAVADFNAKSGSLTKVNIIANIDTLRAVAAFTSELGACILQLQGARVPVEAAGRKFTQASQQTNAYLQGHGKTLELLAEEDLRGRPDQQRWEAINDISTCTQHRSRRHSQNRGHWNTLFG